MAQQDNRGAQQNGQRGSNPPQVPARPPAAEEMNRPQGRTQDQLVTIGCKMPHGVRLHVHRESGETGGDSTKFILDHEVDPVYVNGANHERAVAGFGLTKINKAFWERWLSENKRSMMVENGLLFAVPTMDDAEATAINNENEKTKLEGLDPEKPGPGLVKLNQKPPKTGD